MTGVRPRKTQIAGREADVPILVVLPHLPRLEKNQMPMMVSELALERPRHDGVLENQSCGAAHGSAPAAHTAEQVEAAPLKDSSSPRRQGLRSTRTSHPVTVPPMAAPPIIQRLRAATSAIHQRLDDAMQMQTRVADPVLRRRMVSAFRRFHAHAEARITREMKTVEGLDMAARSRLALIDSDLEALGLVASGPYEPAPPLGFGEALGWLYVVEGSSLGGHVILRTLTDAGIDKLGLSFLDPYGDAVGARWREVMAVLDREVASGRADQDDVLKGALAAFDYAYAVLTPPADE